MKINKAILHILDFKSNITIMSETEIDLTKLNILEFIEKHVAKITNDSSARTGIFNISSSMKDYLDKYINNNIDFIETSTIIANTIAEKLMECETKKSSDILISDFTLDNNQFIGILLYENQIAYTHHVSNSAGKIKNEIINHYSILPNPTQKISAYAFINLTNFEIKVLEKKIFINGKDVNILEDTLLECKTIISEKSTINILKKAAERIAKNNDVDGLEIVVKAKNYIGQNAESNNFIEPSEMSKEIFYNSLKMQNEFLNEVEKNGVEKRVNVNQKYASKISKLHKIKTDTGIEISIPSTYLQNNDFVEFTNNIDGTISIQLKNISNITNR